jgi:hypothetical protein
MRTLILLFVLCLPAMAQRKLWTWTAPYASDAEQIASIHASAADAKGNAALVVGEFKFTGEFPWTKGCRFRLLWISATGVVLNEKVIELPTTASQVMTGDEKFDFTWKIIAVSSRACVVTDGRTIYTSMASGKTVTSKETAVPAGEFVFPASSPEAFAGWFQQKTGSAGAFIYPQENTGFWRTPAEISLWTLR